MFQWLQPSFCLPLQVQGSNGVGKLYIFGMRPNDWSHGTASGAMPWTRPNGEVIQARDLALKTKSWNWMELIFACNNDVTQQMTLPMATRLMQLMQP